MSIEIRPLAADRLTDLLFPIGTAFGMTATPAILDRVRALPELDYRIGAFDGDTVVGAAGSFTFDMTVPGGAAIETAGLTMVGVLPTLAAAGRVSERMPGALGRADALFRGDRAPWCPEIF